MDNIFDTTKWNMERKYVIRRRVVGAIAFAALVVTIGFVSTQVWWTDGGYCIGDMFECIAFD